MTVTHRIEDHTYWDETGYEYHSVTRMLRHEGIYELNPFADRDMYRERGKAVHAGADLVTLGEWDPETTDPRIRRRIQACANFCDHFGFKREYGEQVVACKDFRVAGRFDVAGLITKTEHAGKRALVDFKSGDAPAGVEIQLGLYDYLAEVSLDWKADIRWAVWLRDDEQYRVQPCNDPVAVSVGLSAVTLYQWKRNKGLL